MILTYSSSRASLARWYWRSLRQNRRHATIWLLSVGAAFLLGTTSHSHPILFGLVAAAVIAGFLALYPQIQFKPQVRTLSLEAQGIATTIGDVQQSFRWADVARIDRNPDGILIAFRNLNAFIVPMSAFASNVDLDAVVTELNEWRQAAEPRR